MMMIMMMMICACVMAHSCPYRDPSRLSRQWNLSHNRRNAVPILSACSSKDMRRQEAVERLPMGFRNSRDDRRGRTSTELLQSM